MKDEIFRLLKQAYSPLGLGDEVLLSRAEMLDSLGFVTAGNIGEVISKQKSSLEALQRANDARVTAALKKKAEDDKRKADEEAKRKAEETAKKEAEEAAKRAEEEAKKKSEELLNKGGLTAELKAFLEEMDKRRDESFKAQLDAQKQAYEKSLHDMSDTVKAMKAASEKDAQEKARVERQNRILNKAKELGIPQSRIDEGFVIAEDADDSAISSYLGTVKKNIDASKLPSNSRLMMGDGKPSDDELKNATDALLANIN